MKKILILIFLGLITNIVASEPSYRDEVNSYLEAVADAKRKVRNFIQALETKDKKKILDAMLEVQEDTLAVDELNRQTNSIKKEFKNITKEIKEKTIQKIKQKVAKEYKCSESDVIIKKFTNKKTVKKTNDVKIGHDWDITIFNAKKGEDIFHSKKLKDIVYESYYESIGGKEFYPNIYPKDLAHKAHIEVTSEYHPEAYEGGNDYLTNPEGFNILDVDRLYHTMEHKSLIEKEKALSYLKKGDIKKYEVSIHEQIRQYTKQFSKQIEPRISSNIDINSFIPEHVKKGTAILEKVGKYDSELKRVFTPVDAKKALANMKHPDTIEGIIQKGTSIIPVIEKRKIGLTMNTKGFQKLSEKEGSAVMKILQSDISKFPKLKKSLVYGQKALKIVMVSEVAYFMGRDGVFYALKKVRADESYAEFIFDVYKNALWYGSGVGGAYDEALKEQLELYKKEIQRGEPTQSIVKDITLTVTRTGTYFGRDIAIGVLTMPYVLMDYLIGFEDAEAKERYSKAFLAKVQSIVKTQKEAKKMTNMARDNNIAFKDRKKYFNCLCSHPRCGSLGGVFDPDFDGNGVGPCKCSGPLSTWKGLMTQVPKEQKACVDYIKELNNKITDERVRKLYEEAMRENIKSVSKEIDEIKTASAKKAYKTFNRIKEALNFDKKLKSNLRATVLSKLSNEATDDIEKTSEHPDFDNAIKKLKYAMDIDKEENLNRYKNRISKYKKWQDNWNNLIYIKIPAIVKDFKANKIEKVKKELAQIKAQAGKSLPNRCKDLLKIDKRLKEIEKRLKEQKSIVNSSTIDPTGTWATDQNSAIMRLKLHQNGIDGVYSSDNGKIWGKMVGDTLIGYWSENSSNRRCSIPKHNNYYWGKVELKFTQKSFLGAWGYCNGELTHQWHGKRIKKSNLDNIWTSNQGDIIFNFENREVKAIYGSDNGKLWGKKIGNKFVGYWSENSSSKKCKRSKNGSFYWGRVELDFDSNSFSGAWGYCDDKLNHPWQGSNISLN